MVPRGKCENDWPRLDVDDGCVACGRRHCGSCDRGYTASTGVERTLAETWDGSSWSIDVTRNRSGSALTTLDGVACTTAGCTAVGAYEANSGSELTLAEAES
jgi:hypothetical protein